MNFLVPEIQRAGLATPWFFVALFLVSSLVMLWRLEAMSDRGFEGTVLGTLVMPYCSGLGNLIFVLLMATRGSTNSGAEVMTNCLVNNVTNLTLLVGLPALIWGMKVVPEKDPKKKKKKDDTKPQINRLSLLLTLLAVFFFSGATWALAQDGKLDFADGMVLVGLFLFWQCIHVFEVMKTNVNQNRSFGFMLWLDLLLLGVGAYGVYLSTDWLVEWLSKAHFGFISGQRIGWLSGWLMVLPNALLALYYGWRRRPEVIYSSQAGDGHICIPLCVGLYALFHPLTPPPFFEQSILILGGATAVHCFFVTVSGGLPRLMGLVLIAAYAVFLYQGLLG